MKKGLSIREKVLLTILLILGLYLVYYYMFSIPTKEATEQYKAEAVLVDDQIILADGKVLKLAKMKTELEELKSNGTEGIKELPKYDNRGNLMNELSLVLSGVEDYSITFNTVTINENIVEREVSVRYGCKGYEKAKAVLLDIYDGKYPCIINDVIIAATGDNYSVNLELTYYEYQ